VTLDSVDCLPVSESELLEALSADALSMLAAVGVPAYVVDVHRRVRWQNAASIELVGDLRGRLDASMLGPEDLKEARGAFERKREGASHTEVKVLVARPDGQRVRVAVHSVPLKNASGEMIGAFGLAQVLEEVEPPSESAPLLSPRERETLTLLAAGYSTTQMAQQMGISKETVRNHVKGLLRSLGASSRVEAIAKARRFGLI
jgi:DNA-binding CsgD family transcriptional regulator